MPASPPCWPALLGGKGLLRISLREGLEDDGVRTGDWLDSLNDPIDEGDAVPSLGSLFFLEDLFGSLPRESCPRQA